MRPEKLCHPIPGLNLKMIILIRPTHIDIEQHFLSNYALDYKLTKAIGINTVAFNCDLLPVNPQLPLTHYPVINIIIIPQSPANTEPMPRGLRIRLTGLRL